MLLSLSLINSFLAIHLNNIFTISHLLFLFIFFFFSLSYTFLPQDGHYYSLLWNMEFFLIAVVTIYINIGMAKYNIYLLPIFDLIHSIVWKCEGERAVLNSEILRMVMVVTCDKSTIKWMFLVVEKWTNVSGIVFFLFFFFGCEFNGVGIGLFFLYFARICYTSTLYVNPPDDR